MAWTGSSHIAPRWGFPLVLLLVTFAVANGAEKAAKKSSSASKESSSSKTAPSSSGPKLPGDDGYWTKLLGLGFSEGTLKPAFSPDKLDYTLEISSGKSNELLVTPMINTNKYELLYTPQLFFNGKLKKYSPIQNIEFKQPLNATGPGPLDMQMTVQVKDPKSSSGAFGGGENENTYHIHLIQAPDIEKILTAENIVVLGRTETGEAVTTVDSYRRTELKNEIRYLVGSNVQHVEVTVTCPTEATSLKYNGRTHQGAGPYISQGFEGATKSILGQCIYKDQKWTNDQEMQRTYVITIARSSNLDDTTLDVRLWPPDQAGECIDIGPGMKIDTTKGTKCDPVDWSNLEAGVTPVGCNKYRDMDPGWKCMKGPAGGAASFVGTFNNPHAELLIESKSDGSRYRLWNGIPTEVPIPDTFGNADRLVLEAGKNNKTYTFLYGPPPTCATMSWGTDKFASKVWAAARFVPPLKGSKTSPPALGPPRSWKCPDEKTPKAGYPDTFEEGFAYEVNEDTYHASCNWDPCNPKEDFAFCCRKVRMPCGMATTGQWAVEMDCPKDEVFSPGNKCAQWPCSKDDVKFCCQKKVKGGAAPCTAMQCPADKVLADKAAELSCVDKACSAADEKMCCQGKAICDSMKCPSGFHKKYNAALFMCAGAQCVVTDRDTCCDAAAYCDEFTCPSVGVGGLLGWVPKPDAANIPCGGKPCIEWDTGICCNKMGFCASFECPVGFYMKADSEHIPCEGGGIRNCTQEDDLMKCCQPAARCLESNICTAGYHFKLDSVNLLCRSAECQLSDREVCCDMVNPFKAASSVRVIPGDGEGGCKMLENAQYFKCEATGHFLNLEVEYTFDKPVGNKVYMGETMISGKVGKVKIPRIEVHRFQHSVHTNVDSLVAGRGAVEHRIEIVVVPPDDLSSIPREDVKKATHAPTTPAPASNSSSKASAESSKADKDESSTTSEPSSASDKESKGTSSSSDKSSKDSSSSSAESSSTTSEPSKDSSSESGTVEHALRQLRERDDAEASAESSDSADTWLV